jgi:hypothetical protein
VIDRTASGLTFGGGAMIVRFKVRCQPDETEQVRAVLRQSLVGEPEATIFYVSSSEPWGD